MPRYPTDEELATAIEKIMIVVREGIADFKAAAPALVQSFSDDEWAKLKADEDRRRQDRKEIPQQTLALVRLLSDPDLTRLLWFISNHNWQKASRELLAVFIKAGRKTKQAQHG